LAILDDGIIVSANQAFASRLGYDSPEDIESIPLLDLISGLTKQAFRDYLAQAKLVEKYAKHTPEALVNIKQPNGTETKAQLHAHTLRLNGEELVELELLTENDLTLKGRVSRLPWKLYFCFLCLLIVAVLPNLLLPNLNINNAPKTFLPSDAPSVVFDDKVRETFPDDEVIIILFEGVALFSDGFLNAYYNLGETLAEHELIDDVISLTRQDHISGSEEGFLVDPLIDIENLENTTPQERLNHVISDRFAKNSLVAADGSAIALVIIPQALDDSIRHLALEEEILTIINDHQLDGYLSVMAGEIPTDVAQMRAILRDNMIFIPATVIVGLLLVWWLFHRVLAVIVTGVTTGAVVSSTITFYVLFQQPFNSISGIIPPLLSALTIAALVHLFNALHYASKRGFTGKDRVNAALSEIKRPALFSALTTSAGLASLGLSPIPPISVFGLTAAIGVLLIYLIVIHILPTIFARFDMSDWPSRASGLTLMDTLVKKLFHTGLRNPAIVLICIFFMLAATIPFITKVEVETNIQEFFPPTHSLRKATDYVEEKLVGTTPLEIIFSTSSSAEMEAEILTQPETLHYFKDFQVWLEKQPEVDKTVSVVDFIEEMNWGFHSQDDNFLSIPKDSNLISQYLFIYDGEDMYDFIDEDYQQARVAMNVNVHGANQISELMKKTEQYLTQNPLQSTQWRITGAGRLFADQETLLIEGQILSLGGALLLIFTLMLILWRSLKDTLICMIPNLSPIVLIFIIMGIFGIWLDMATAMIASVAVGIAIDDTIHIYHGFIDRVKQGAHPVFALARTYHQAGRAVMTTTIILCSQFLLLLASAFVPMGHFGVLTSVGLLAALIFDLLLLPALLIVIFRVKQAPPTLIKPKAKTVI
jgi:predicted RND superfamily exporter protein